MTQIILAGMGPTVLVVVWVQFAIGTILFALRIYCNAFINRQWNQDFWWASATYVIGVIANIFLTVACIYGMGVHLDILEKQYPDSLEKNQFYEWVYTTFMQLSIALGKVAIIVFILEIEGSALRRSRRYILYFILFVNTALVIGIIPIIWLQCDPVPKLWKAELNGNCNGRQRNEYYAYFAGSWGALVDVALAMYPALIFWNLQLRTYVKVGLAALFGFGLVAAVCAAIKTRELSTLTATADITYQLAVLDIWASTEQWVVFIVCCIPTIRPIFVKLFRVVAPSTSQANRTFTKNGYIAQKDGPGAGNQSRAYASQLRADMKDPVMTSKTDSEENILPGQEGIMMTRKISVHYEGQDPYTTHKSENDSERGWKTHFDETPN